MKLNEVKGNAGDAAVLFSDYVVLADLPEDVNEDVNEVLRAAGAHFIKHGFHARWSGSQSAEFVLVREAVEAVFPSPASLEQATTPGERTVTISRLEFNATYHSDTVAHIPLTEVPKLDVVKIVEVCNRMHADAIALRKLVK